ncbi:Metallo-dependent phosphatase [Xylaria bambusicola]|uniref:Metallo-dependent phosphatase n=1 Tax=Xylaria bambusicola TaxID=326684 RepID=UPI0020080E4E|nr:Metallo-dependent phosphatase [Xylaria bambusicola]KAI0509593.1 Metallo-dependent phosphatase [Xylaria bambusicola]
MACDTPGRSLVRTFILTTIALVLITLFTSYLRLNPTAFAPFHHTASNKPDEPRTDTDMALNLPNYDKYVAEMKDSAEMPYPQLSTRYPHISTLPEQHLPNTPYHKGTPRRLIFIGDVHGHRDALKALLKKAEFRRSFDTVIFAGDMVNKGPDSDGVVELAIEIGAYGVRGNHEDRVLRAYDNYMWKEWKKSQKRKGARIDSNTDDGDEDQGEEEEADDATESTNSKNVEFKNQQTLEREPENEKGVAISARNKIEKKSPGNEYGRKSLGNKKGTDKGKKDKKGKDKSHKHITDLDTARSLSSKSRKWLSKLPLILRIGDLGPRYGNIFVVHAGLVPGVPLKDQDPEAVMNMRTLVSPTSVSEQEPLLADQSQTNLEKTTSNNRPNIMIPSPNRDGTPWAKTWSFLQKAYMLAHPHEQPTTVIYGHDAKAGLQLRRYTFGLDSGCGSDNTLTALILEPRSIPHSSDGGEQLSEGEADIEIEKIVTGIENLGREQIRHRLVSVSCHETGKEAHESESKDEIDSEAKWETRRQDERETEGGSESEIEDEIDSEAEQASREQWMRDWETRREAEGERENGNDRGNESESETGGERSKEIKREE